MEELFKRYDSWDIGMDGLLKGQDNERVTVKKSIDTDKLFLYISFISSAITTIAIAIITFSF